MLQLHLVKRLLLVNPNKRKVPKCDHILEIATKKWEKSVEDHGNDAFVKYVR